MASNLNNRILTASCLGRFVTRINEAISRRKTRAFLDSVWGTWVGDESAEEILQSAKSHSSKEVIIF